MKKYRCLDCPRTRDVEDDKVILTCLCGGHMKLEKSGLLSNDLSKDDQVLIKTVFKRGVASGKEPDASQILDSIKNERIKVNLQ